MANVINATSTGNGGLITTGDDSGVLNIQTNETTAATIDASQNVSFTNGVNLPNTFGFKNRLINGQMWIDQRNGGAAKNMSSTSNGYGLDRWTFGYVTSGTATVQQSTDGAGGCYYSQKYTTVTTTTAADYTFITQLIEANNVSDLNWGTSSGVATSVSFWAKANNSGTYQFYLRYLGGTTTYYYISTFALTANTWTYVTISVPAPPTAAGAFGGTQTSEYVQMGFVIQSSGMTPNGTNNAWQSSGNRLVTGTFNLASTAGATFQWTAMQFEKGTQATSFDFRSYGTELALCQRYYQDSLRMDTTGGSSAQGVSTTGELSAGITFKCSMRAAPSITLYDEVGTAGKVCRLVPGSTWNSGSTGGAYNANTYGFWLSSSSGAAAAGVFARFTANAEL
jgi:hypothetical protein